MNDNEILKTESVATLDPFKQSSTHSASPLKQTLMQDESDESHSLMHWYTSSALLIELLLRIWVSQRSCFVRVLGLLHWLVSNFIPMISKKFEFRDFDSIIRFTIKNESKIKRLRSHDLRIFLKIRFYEIETLTRYNVNT